MMREERAMICVCGKGLTLLIGGGQLQRIYISRIPVKLDRTLSGPLRKKGSGP